MKDEKKSPADFSLGDDHGLTCPNGQTSYTRMRTVGSDKSGYTFRFPAKPCQDCPLIAQCRGEAVKPTAHRQACTERSRSVFISDY